MEQEVKDTLIKQRPFLVHSIKIDEDFFKAMKDVELITHRQEARIKNSGPPYTQIETLLDLLPKLGRKAFTQFCQALEETEQKKIVKKLLSKLGSNNQEVEDMDVANSAAPPTTLTEPLVSPEEAMATAQGWLKKTKKNRVVITEVSMSNEYLCAVTEKPGTSLTSGESEICLPYLAPEALDPPQHSHKADVWGVGCAIINLLLGTPPWSDKSKDPEKLNYILRNTHEIQNYIPKNTEAEIWQVLRYMLAPEPDRRWDADSLLECKILKDAGQSPGGKSPPVRGRDDLPFSPQATEASPASERHPKPAEKSQPAGVPSAQQKYFCQAECVQLFHRTGNQCSRARGHKRFAAELVGILEMFKD